MYSGTSLIKSDITKCDSYSLLKGPISYLLNGKLYMRYKKKGKKKKKITWGQHNKTKNCLMKATQQNKKLPNECISWSPFKKSPHFFRQISLNWIIKSWQKKGKSRAKNWRASFSPSHTAIKVVKFNVSSLMFLLCYCRRSCDRGFPNQTIGTKTPL